jgi:hypothetical protein
MTPEERVLALIELRPTALELVAAIRAAENDALELAACGLDYEYDQAASYVRSRKHK